MSKRDKPSDLVADAMLELFEKHGGPFNLDPTAMKALELLQVQREELLRRGK